MTMNEAIASPPIPGQLDAEREADRRAAKAAGISDRRLAESTSAGEQDRRGAGETSSRSNQPCSMSRARLTPVAAPVKPAPCSRLTGIMKLW